MKGIGLILLGGVLVLAPSAEAQTTGMARSSGMNSEPTDEEQNIELRSQQQMSQGRREMELSRSLTPDSAVGRTGQRQTRDTAAIEAGIIPMARVANRIQNRLQTRIRTRIDRDYDPQAGTSDRFTAAQDRADRSTRSR